MRWSETDAAAGGDGVAGAGGCVAAWGGGSGGSRVGHGWADGGRDRVEEQLLWGHGAGASSGSVRWVHELRHGERDGVLHLRWEGSHGLEVG